MLGKFPRDRAGDYGLPERASRQWVIENAGLADKVMLKTPDWVDIPIPGDRSSEGFTHACYLVLCDHEDFCTCSDDDSLEWTFVEFLNLNEIQPPAPG